MRDDPFDREPKAPPEDAEEAFRRAAERTLRLLVPPLVHKLNNLVTQAVGRLELGVAGQGFGEERPSARDPLLRLSERMRHLALFALSAGRARDVAELADTLRSLLEPLASQGRVRFELEELVEAEFPGGLEAEAQLVVVLARELRLAAPLDPAGSASTAPGRVRLRLEARGPERFAATCTSVRPRAAEGTAAADAACARVLAALLEPLGGALAVRALGAARCTRIVLPARLRGSRRRPARQHARILLVEGDSLDRRLVGDVLSEAGFAVASAAGETEAERALFAGERFDLALVEGAVLGDSPGLLPKLAAAGIPAAAYGRKCDSAEGLRRFEGKLMADPLIRFVRSCLIPR